MFQFQVDEQELRDIAEQQIKEKVEAVNHDLVYWDAKELKRRTCMSWNTIQDKFFHDPHFPKFKVGNKWFFPAKEAEEFLSKWAESHWKGERRSG